jgi:hypothetical protein
MTTTTLVDLIEFVAGRASLNRALNVIEGTVLITSRSVNGGKGGRRYSDRALRQIAAMAEGLPAYLNHVSPEMAFKPRDVKDLIGVHRNIRYFPNEGKVMSDLHVAEHHAPLVFGLAETLGGVIGNSLVSRGGVRMENGTEVVEEILLLRSADLVSDPATTKGLFEAREARSETTHLDEAEERLRCAIEGQPYFNPAERAKIDTMAEAWRRGDPITDALIEGRARLPQDVEARLAEALGLVEARNPLPEDVARRVTEIIRAATTGGPALPDGIEARLARAL